MAEDRNPFLERLKRDYKDDDDGLRAANAKVEDTLNSQGWTIIQRLIADARRDAEIRLFGAHRGGSGQVLEQAKYAQLCGYLAGLSEQQTAADAFALAVKRLERHLSPE